MQRNDDIAGHLVAARLSAQALTRFPGPQPETLQAAYACQDAAIGLWPGEIVGWKIGRLAPDQEKTFGEVRLAGPIFRQNLHAIPNAASVPFPVFNGGFAAVESEFVFRVGRDAPADKMKWSGADAIDMVAALHIGIETAGSPMAMINDLGATVIISDFGNNAGLILGTEIQNWQARALDSLTCRTSINGLEVGRGTAAGIPGGPVEALRFLLEHCASRGRPLTKGVLVSTGAVTGIHSIAAGQAAVADFGQDGQIVCHAVTATAK